MPLNENPPYIPRWEGLAPVFYWIGAEAEEFRAELWMGIETWARELTKLRVVETVYPGGPRTIRVTMEPLSGVLGLGFYPPELIPEPKAGDIVINSNVDWTLPVNRALLLPLAVHEAGHSFGMGHSYDAESVMFPNITPGKVNLALIDKWQFRALYNGEITPHPGKGITI